MASGASPRLISVFSASSGSVGAEGEGGAERDGAGAGALGISVGRSVGAAVTALPLTAPRSSAPSSPHPARSNGKTAATIPTDFFLGPTLQRIVRGLVAGHRKRVLEGRSVSVRVVLAGLRNIKK